MKTLTQKTTQKTALATALLAFQVWQWRMLVMV